MSGISHSRLSAISHFDDERTVSQYSELSKIASANTWFEELAPYIPVSPSAHVQSSETICTQPSNVSEVQLSEPVETPASHMKLPIVSNTENEPIRMDTLGKPPTPK